MSTEVEAKFPVDRPGTLEDIRALTRLGAFSLLPGRLTAIEDTYLDTAGRALMAAGYACRRRRQEGGVVLTVKSLTPPAGEVHRREELEVAVDEDAPPDAWPASPARGKVLDLIGGQPLDVLFRMKQDRFVRHVVDGDRHVATASLDEVIVGGVGTERRWHELEVELAPGGTEGDLAAIVEWVRTTLKLEPSAVSKFEKALNPSAEGRHPARLPGARKPRRPAPLETILFEASEEMSETVFLGAIEAMGYAGRLRRRKSDRPEPVDAPDGALLHKAGLPHLEATLSESEYALEGFAAPPIRLVTQQWTFQSPFHDAAPRGLLRLAVSGPSTGLAYFSSLLQERLGCVRPRESLFERGLRLFRLSLPGAPLPAEFRVSTGDSVARACTRILRGEAWRMRANTQGAIQDLDPEYVHDLRVASRRARSAVRLFSFLFEDRAGQVLREDLGWIAGLLGGVRDLDVFMARLKNQLALVEADPQFREILQARLLGMREGALSELVAALRSERYAGLLQRLEAEAAPPAGPAAARADQLAGAFAKQRIDKAFRKLGHHVDQPPENYADGELHRLRILFKRLRYTCEFFRPLLGSDVGDLIGSFVTYQDCLGLHQDASTALQMLSRFLAEGPGQGLPEASLLAMGALMQVQREMRKTQREKFLRRWKTAPRLLARWKSIRAAGASGV